MSRTLPLLAFPSLLHPMSLSLATASTPSQSWIQLAKTGSFVSNRYGRFQITKDDLRQMKANHARPVPLDYDHIALDPKKPGDGIAAGWISELDLRDDDTTLWGLTEFTPRAAAAIRDKEYQFISPSFVKDHTNNVGKKIGTALLASALTNFPFLVGMKALTLYSFSAMGDLAVAQLETDNMNRPLHLAAFDTSVVGTIVTFNPTAAASVPQYTPEQQAGTYRITEAIGQGDDAVVMLEALDGTPLGLVRAKALAPADPPEETPSPLPENTVEVPANTALAVPPEGVPQGGLDPRIAPRNFNHGAPAPVTTADAAEAALLALSEQIAKDQGISLAAATKQAAMLHRDWVDLRNDIAPEPEPEPVVSLSATMQAATNFIDLVHSVQATHKLTDLREAISLASQVRPDLAIAYRENGI